VTDQVTDQVAERCPGCSAAVRPGAPWCTLCFADLRPAPPPELEPVRHGVAAVDPLTASLAVLDRDADAADGSVTPDSTDLGWPCLRCGEQVGIELSECPVCGAGFMQLGERGDLLGLGRFGGKAPDKKTQAFIMIGGAGLICLGILAILFVIGTLF
jgi:hypothetical protein